MPSPPATAATTSGALSSANPGTAGMIFSELSPIVQALLASLQRSDHSDGDRDDTADTILATLRIRSNMIRRLVSAIENVSRVQGGPEALIQMAEFVLLPLILVLQSGIDARSDRCTSPSSYYIRRSAQIRCVEDAAMAMEAYVGAISSRNNNSLDGAIVIRCLVSCTMALSTVETALTDDGDGNIGTGEKEPQSRCADAQHALETGEDCRLWILKAISCLYSMARDDDGASTSDRLLTSSFSRTIANHMDGMLLIRVVGGCMAILQSLKADDTAEIKNASPEYNRHRRSNWSLGLAVLDTLQIMLCSVPIKEVWCKVLPGLFATLFKVSLSSCRIRASGTLSSSKLGARSITTIALLLRVSIGMENSESSFTESATSTSSRSCTQTMISAASDKLLSAAFIAGGTAPEVHFSTESKADGSSISAESPFMDEVNERLPAPLRMIINVSSVHSSAEVKEAALVLVRVLLVDTRTVWSQPKKACSPPRVGTECSPPSDSLSIVALECCLSLLNDEGHEKVAATARGVLHSYRNLHTEQTWKLVCSAIVPRVVELIQGLPSLASRGRESELRPQIRLVGGYLRVALDDTCVGLMGNVSSRDERKQSGDSVLSKKELRRRGDLASALACEGVSSVIRLSLTELLQLDPTTLPLSPDMPSSRLLLEQSGSMQTINSTGRARYAFLRDEESISSTLDMLNLLGRALGARKGALFVDACIADLSDHASSLHADMSWTGKSQVQWLSRCSGLPVLAGEILSAAFGGGEGCCNDKILRSLVSAILPIITRPPLWSLPTSLESVEDHALPSESMDKSALVMHSYLSSTDGVDNLLNLDGVYYGGQISTRTVKEEASASAFSGNAVFISALMDIINAIAELLGESITPFLPLVLYSVVEKTSPVHHHHVQQSAWMTLEHLAKAEGCSDLNIFLTQNLDYLVDSIIGTLRQRFGEKRSEDLFCSGAIDILLRALGKSWELDHFDINAAHVVRLAELLDHVMVAYDDSEHMVHTGRDMRRNSALKLIKVFDAAIFSLRMAISNVHRKGRFGGEVDRKGPVIEANEPWLASLADFKVEEHYSDDDGGDEESMDGSALAAEEDKMDNSVSLPTKNRQGDQVRERAWLASVIASTNSILSRCCYLLSIPDLQVERATCKCITSALRLLALAEEAQTIGEDGEDEDEVPGVVGNALLMSISDIWPSIYQRLKTISHQAKDNERTVLILSGSQLHNKNTPSFKDKVFIAELFELIGCVCELSGDFMTSRFEHDVWPVFAELIGHEVMLRDRRRKGHTAGQKPNLSKNISATRKAIASTDLCDSALSNDRNQVALLAMLACIAQCLQSRVLGVGLMGLVSSVGTLVLPLLADDGKVGDAAAEVVKSLLALDSDALWRPLMTLSGGGHVSPRPYKSRSTISRNGTGCPLDIIVTEVADERVNNSLTKRVHRLMDFAGSLTEQVIV